MDTMIKRISARFIKKIHRQPLTDSSCLYLSESSKRQGIDKLYLILSFDCDTILDALASEKIAENFLYKGIPAVFGVPGQTLEKNTTVYKKIKGMGFEFLNHGYLDHAAYDDDKGRYYSTTWYHQMTEREVRKDIQEGHECIRGLLNINPVGFRAPHFGYYQDHAQLEIIYSEIAGLGYSYASTTMPVVGLKKGPLFPVSYKLYEFPVTGTYDQPAVILDSWQFFEAPDRVYTEKDFTIQFHKLVDYYSGNSLPCILNFYVDPSHVIDRREYFDCLEYASGKGVEFSTYSQILSKIKGQ
jgi:hypothetical protein